MQSGRTRVSATCAPVLLLDVVADASMLVLTTLFVVPVKAYDKTR